MVDFFYLAVSDIGAIIVPLMHELSEYLWLEI